MVMVWARGGGDVRRAEGQWWCGRQAGVGVSRGTGQRACSRHTQETRRGARTEGHRRALVCGTMAYGGGPTWRVGPRRARGCVPVPFRFGLSRFDQV
jgi:hypothetical protein